MFCAARWPGPEVCCVSAPGDARCGWPVTGVSGGRGPNPRQQGLHNLLTLRVPRRDLVLPPGVGPGVFPAQGRFVEADQLAHFLVGEPLPTGGGRQVLERHRDPRFELNGQLAPVIRRHFRVTLQQASNESLRQQPAGLRAVAARPGLQQGAEPKRVLGEGILPAGGNGYRGILSNLRLRFRPGVRSGRQLPNLRAERVVAVGE